MFSKEQARERAMSCSVVEVLSNQLVQQDKTPKAKTQKEENIIRKLLTKSNTNRKIFNKSVTQSMCCTICTDHEEEIENLKMYTDEEIDQLISSPIAIFNAGHVL